MNKQSWKQILISILIGAIVAFLSSLFDGFLNFLKENGNNIVGGGATSITYLLKKYLT